MILMTDDDDYEKFSLESSLADSMMLLIDLDFCVFDVGWFVCNRNRNWMFF